MGQREKGLSGAGKAGVIVSPESAAAISEFLKKGGRVSKLPPAVPATGREIVEYLRSCGIAARCYKKVSTTTYIYKDKAVTLRKLVELANKQRRAEQLPPFAPRVDLTAPFASARHATRHPGA